MKFNERQRLDTGRVSDRRGVGGPAAAGLGGMGIIGVILMLVLSGGDPAVLSESLGAGPITPTESADLAAECQTGADANERQDCRIVAVLNSLDEYWMETSAQLGIPFNEPTTTLFEGSVTTGGCGSATSAVGPFYCPADEGIYLDLNFFGELERRFGASGGDTAEAYVMAHEYGHHMQNLIGTSDQVRQLGQTSGEDSAAVALELQADCYAGAWVGNAVQTELITEVSDEDIEEALSAAEAVGDDSIQESSGSAVNPDSWTHGSSAQRQQWFTTGLNSGDPRSCDTFNE
ncbi:UNVERIFIED_CONTAM: hypothetical protein GTU68_044812 [Idotea baltica]|nr:hypothetical protein [Idotea baltica]